jgi:hypothetical protein
MMVDVILNFWEKQRTCKYFESYWIFDMHGTIIKPNHIRGNTDLNYYPFAKECLQILTSRPDIRIISFTSSYTEDLKEYVRKFKEDDIIFNYLKKILKYLKKWDVWLL